MPRPLLRVSFSPPGCSAGDNGRPTVTLLRREPTSSQRPRASFPASFHVPTPAESTAPLLD